MLTQAGLNKPSLLSLWTNTCQSMLEISEHVENLVMSSFVMQCSSRHYTNKAIV